MENPMTRDDIKDRIGHLQFEQRTIPSETKQHIQMAIEISELKELMRAHGWK